MAKEFIVDGKVVVQEDALDNYDEKSEIELSFVPIHEITYKPTNGFGTYVCELANCGDNPPIFNAKGTFVRPLDLGQSYAGKGEINSWRGQKQYKISEVSKITPKGKRNIISFLRSLDGMRFQAEIIWETYKDNSIQIIKEHPLDLMNILSGVYPELLYDWKNQIDNLRDDYDILNKLMAYGIRSDKAKDLYDKYGGLIFDMLKENPYFLSKEVRGYGFKKCDQVAKKIGIPINNVNRLAEGIMALIDDISLKGDTYIFKSDLTDKAIDELSLKMTIPEMKSAIKKLNKDGTYTYTYAEQEYVIDGMVIENALKAYGRVFSQKQKDACKVVVIPLDKKDIEDAYQIMLLEERIYIEEDKVFAKEIYLQESGIAIHLQKIVKAAVPISRLIKNYDPEKELDKYCEVHNLSLEEKQREAIISAISTIGGVLIINGAAGCGKTFCINIAMNILEDIYRKSVGFFSDVIMAPTGKASKVAAKATGRPASTIHRALVNKPGGGFTYTSSNPMPYNCIILDEGSMLDCELAFNLFSAIAAPAKLIIMGDTNQLPAIGAGNVLRDMISSNLIKTVTLNVIKRQGLDSGIVLNAHRIVVGEMVTSHRENMDFVIYKAENDVQYTQKVLQQADAMVSKYGLGGMQVLAPQRTGPQGTNYLNFILQERYNTYRYPEKILKQKFEVALDGVSGEYELYLKVGDKVINTRNNYSASAFDLVDGRLCRNPEKDGITNGETGTIVKISQQTNQYNEWENLIVVQFDDKLSVYENNFDDLELCYAMTIHKSQGSEWPGVILLVSPAQKYMLDKNLLYTGVTRAKDKAVIVSDGDILKFTINQDKIEKRHTDLINKLYNVFSGLI